MHTNKINGKKYIGITSQEPQKRWANGCGYYTNKHFNNAIKKYGWNNFEHQVITTNQPFQHACNIERYLIKAYNSNNSKYGYNISSGGECGASGRKLSDETKRKLRITHLGKHHTQETKLKLSKMRQGELNNFYGKHHTEQTRKIMSEKAKERDPTTINMNGLSHHGTTYWTEETYKKLSEANRGEGSGTHKLSEADVIDILKMIKRKQSYKDIKQKYNISDAEISRIKHRKRWGYLYEKYSDLYA
jgi:group I intron endonuclease